MMKLLKNDTSPFARIAWASLIEAGLEDRFEARNVDHWGEEPLLMAVNSAGRIPCLVLDDGTSIAESLLIAMFADGQGSGRLFAGGAPALTIAGIAMGVCDAAVQTLVGRRILSGNFVDTAFDEGDLAAKRRRAMAEGLKRLDAKVAADGSPANGETPEISAMAAITARDYVRLRFPHAEWMPQTAYLDRLADRFAERPSIARTRPFL